MKPMAAVDNSEAPLRQDDLILPRFVCRARIAWSDWRDVVLKARLQGHSITKEKVAVIGLNQTS